MFPVTTLLSVRCRSWSSLSLFAATMWFQAFSDLTPTMSTFHHSGALPLLVATMWLCGGSARLPVPAPRTADRSMVDGWSMHLPAVGHCRVDAGGVNPSGTTTYSGSKPLSGAWV